MSFPPQPGAGDEQRSELLRLMSVRGYPHVYVLGCFARYVTIYAQQVRALNLVHALAASGVLSERSEVAVIGGGIAGLTAAAAVAVRGAARVEVFEKEQSTMRLQRNSGQRYVHPFIYDWPGDSGSEEGEPGESNREETDLPLMNWKAGIAREVVKRLDAEWDAIRKLFPERLPEPRTSCGKVEVVPGMPRPAVRLGDAEPREYDVVILAVGFGKDGTEAFGSYWSDTGIDGPDVDAGQSWLVSGAGDGALTDLMRLCVADFWHDDVIRYVAARTRGVGKELLAAEAKAAEAARGAASPEAAQEIRYRALRRPFEQAVAAIAPMLGEHLRPRNLDVTLVASECDLVAGRSSLLNRLITFYLYGQKRFRLRPGRLEREAVAPGSTRERWVLVEGTQRSPVDAHRVLPRHGPDRALKRGFEKVAQRCRTLQRTWEAARQHDDWTRKQLYRPGDFEPGKAPPLRVDFGEQIGTVVFGGVTELEGQSLQTRVMEALAVKRADIEGREERRIERVPVFFDVREVFGDAAAYERAVRALCAADVAVFDLTGYTSGMLVLLGIRAAVRRGVTVTVTTQAGDDDDDAPLPFNLAALNPVRIGTEGDYLQVADAVEAGFRSLRTDPDAYLDLPAFDALRQVGEYTTIPPTQQILFLCWFNPAYKDRVADPLRQRLRERFGDTRIVTTLDSRSPQLIEQRLYAEIRRTQLCVVDWTGSRPNVFFELGVRLAASAVDPLSIVYRGGAAHVPEWLAKALDASDAAPDATAAPLRRFFAPAPFDVEDRSELERHLGAFVRDGGVRMEGAMLSPGRTHRVVCEALHRRQEPGGREVHHLLAEGAERLAGPAVPEAGELPVLFSEALAGQVRRASVEYLAAAWFYLDGRHRLLERRESGELGDGDPRLQEFLAVGRQLRDRLRHVPGEEYTELALAVGRALETLEPPPAAGDVVGRARALKARAINARDAGDLAAALAALSEAEELLHVEAAKLEEARLARPAGVQNDPGEYERAVLEQLPHVLGSKGGVLRIQGGADGLRESLASYDRGYEAEQRITRFNVPMSYNLVQRLVARVLLDPGALEDEAGSVHGVPLRAALREAAGVVDAQIRGTRARDVWAAADLAVLRILLGGEGWEDAMERFLAGPPAPDLYALRVTGEVIGQLSAGGRARGDAARALVDRLTLARDEIGVALDRAWPLDV